MILSDISVKRPVFASVISLLLVVFGIVSYTRLSLREYPDIDPPVITINVSYPGASATVVENRVTQIIEDRISGISGIRFMDSTSEDGRSRVTLQFATGKDIDAAANDVRDKISGILDNLPDEAEQPEVQKVDSSDDVIIWLSLTSTKMSIAELTDYADRYLVDQFSVLDGVSQIRVSGAQTYAMRIWIDRLELAARNLTVQDIENTLRSENVELPAGSIESTSRQFTARINRVFTTPENFGNLVIGRGTDGYLIRLSDVARVEMGVEEDRTTFRGNGVLQVGLGVIKQSNANTLSVAKTARDLAIKLNGTLPDGMAIAPRYDTSVFVENAIHEVFITLGIAIVLVVLVIYAFLGRLSMTIIPAVAVPVSLLSSFIVLLIMGFSINILTLLALILAIGMVVDDAIIVVENISRRMHENAEDPLNAAFYGTRQVGFAVLATTLTLMSVFLPITFLEGDVGRLFSEFAITIAAAIGFSGLVALTLTPMLSSVVIRHKPGKGQNTVVDRIFGHVRTTYMRSLRYTLRHSAMVIAGMVAIIAAMIGFYLATPSEYTPREDRGAFLIMVNGPEGATYSYMKEYLDEIEKRVQPYLKSGEAESVLVRAPRGFGNTESFNNGLVIMVLSDWGHRRSAFAIMDEIRGKLSDLTGIRAFPVMRQGFTGSTGKPVQFVIGGGTYEQLREWRDILLAKINENNPGLKDIDWSYKETKPQQDISIDYTQAAELGVTVSDIGRALETMLGGRTVTTYTRDGTEYDVILEGERNEQRTVSDIQNIYVRSARSGELIPLSNLVSFEETADAAQLARYNRVRSITIEANLDSGLTLGKALEFLEKTTRDNLPETVKIDYKGQSLDYISSSGSIYFVFLLGILVMYLIMAAQFESFIHPFIILFTVPLAMTGGLAGLYITGQSLNIFTQIGLIMLVGLAAKNGILIVEFANQLREKGKNLEDAILEAAELRLRPILMTSITAIAGAIPLMISHGAGFETRSSIGVVICFGVAAATVFTIYVIPSAYKWFGKYSGNHHDIAKRLGSGSTPIETVY